MSEKQFLTLVGLIMTSIIINVTIVGLSHKSLHKRIDDFGFNLSKRIDGLHDNMSKRIDDLADDIRAIREDIRLIMNKLIPERKSKK